MLLRHGNLLMDVRRLLNRVLYQMTNNNNRDILIRLPARNKIQSSNIRYQYGLNFILPLPTIRTIFRRTVRTKIHATRRQRAANRTLRMNRTLNLTLKNTSRSVTRAMPPKRLVKLSRTRGTSAINRLRLLYRYFRIEPNKTITRRRRPQAILLQLHNRRARRLNIILLNDRATRQRRSNVPFQSTRLYPRPNLFLTIILHQTGNNRISTNKRYSRQTTSPMTVRRNTRLFNKNRRRKTVTQRSTNNLFNNRPTRALARRGMLNVVLMSDVMNVCRQTITPTNRPLYRRGNEGLTLHVSSL